MAYMNQKLFTFREHLGHTWFLGEFHITHFFSFQCCVAYFLLCFVCLLIVSC